MFQHEVNTSEESPSSTSEEDSATTSEASDYCVPIADSAACVHTNPRRMIGLIQAKGYVHGIIKPEEFNLVRNKNHRSRKSRFRRSHASLDQNYYFCHVPIPVPVCHMEYQLFCLTYSIWKNFRPISSLLTNFAIKLKIYIIRCILINGQFNSVLLGILSDEMDSEMLPWISQNFCLTHKEIIMISWFLQPEKSMTWYDIVIVLLPCYVKNINLTFYYPESSYRTCWRTAYWIW